MEIGNKFVHILLSKKSQIYANNAEEKKDTLKKMLQYFYKWKIDRKILDQYSEDKIVRMAMEDLIQKDITKKKTKKWKDSKKGRESLQKKEGSATETFTQSEMKKGITLLENKLIQRAGLSSKIS